MKNKKRLTVSRIADRIVLRFVLSCLLLAFALVGGFCLARFLCSLVVWRGSEPLYRPLKTLEVLAPVVIVLLLLGGVFLLGIFSIRSAARYLNDLADAAKSLSHPDENPIRLPEELSDVENELNLAREQALRNIDAANEAVQRKNDLIMYLAHDLKTPLASVIGYLTLLRDEGQISEKLRTRYLSIALDKAERLEELMNEFFEITRFNLSHIDLQYSRIDLTRLLEQLIYEFTPMLREKSLTCRLLAPEELTLRCDGDKMQRVFDNLLRNAVLYSYEGTEITITAAAADGCLRVEFADRGPEIPREKLERIFEQFYRLDAARGTGSGGAGLGLAIARQIAELHGGTITADSQGETATFTVTLPLTQLP